MKPLLLAGAAFLLMSGCDQPHQSESREPVGTLDLADVRARELMRAADADSGYGECLMAGLQEGMSKIPEPTDDDTFLEFAADYAERACEAEFGRIVTALRAKAPGLFHRCE